MTLKRERISLVARSWWSAFRVKENPSQVRPGFRGALARLRRAEAALDALQEQSTFDLYRALDLGPKGEFKSDDNYRNAAAKAFSRVAVLASVLAHVREDDKDTYFGRALGPPAKDETAKLKPLRLARLLSARGDEEISDQFRRAVKLLGGTANVGDLAWLILTWDRDEIGDRTRTLFAFAYHDAAQHAPPGPGDEEPANDADPAPELIPST